MEALLIERWLGTSDAIDVIDQASVSLVRERVRTEGAAVGLPDDATSRLVIVASELANNQLAHARGGRVAIRAVRRGESTGLEVVAADRGAGLKDPAAALAATTLAPAGLGMGLAGVVELADEVDFDVRAGEGTCVWARKFPAQIRGRCIGVYGRPIGEEPASGDDAAWVRDGGEIFVAVSDGLGHGPEARAASSIAVRTAVDDATHPLDEVVERCHAAIHGTRGAVLALARIGQDGRFEACAVGDAEVAVLGLHETRRFGGVSRVLGARGHARRARPEHDVIGAREVLVLYSDGLTSRTSLEGDPRTLLGHPITIAHALVTRFARERDDAIVAVIG